MMVWDLRKILSFFTTIQGSSGPRNSEKYKSLTNQISEIDTSNGLPIIYTFDLFFIVLYF